MSKILFVHMLGGLRLQIGGEVVSKFRTQKTASLLGYLAFYSQRSHSREELVDRFWPDSEIDAGRTSLRTSLASLRQQLEPPGVSAGAILEADRTFVRLNPEFLDKDVTQFEAAWASGARIQDPSERAEALAAAAEIYRGPLLSGHYDDWILQERDRLQQAYTSILRSAASASRDVGDIQRAIHCLQKLLAVEPLLEEAHLELMKAYAASGNSPAALRQYREQERILRDEMSSTPSAEARELYEQLSRGIVPDDLLDLARAARNRPQAPLPPPSPAPAAGFVPVDRDGGIGRARAMDPLPISLTRFFGRDAEIAAIQKSIITDKSRLVTLTGPGGSGKTRLAIEAARRIAEKFRGEVAFVPLSDLTDARLIPDAIGEALDIARDKAARPMDQIAEVLRNRRYLLVIDSFEQLVEEGSQIVFTLLERAPTLTCLVTSRQRLDVGGEHELAVAPLPVPTMAGNPEHLSRFASVALFVDRAQSARAGFTLSGENAAAVAAVCERLEGIPLAIELAAAWADILTPAQILARLSHRFELLSSRRKDLAPRHQTLRAAFDWSYRLLSPEAQRFFTMLSVFRGGWTLEAAEHVCDEPRAMMYLQQLRERSLLIAQESGDEMRFRLLDTLREYAGEQLSDSEREACNERHLEFYESFVKRTAEHLHGPLQSYWLERLEQEYDNSRAALEWVLRNPRCLETGLRLAGSLSFFWGVRSHVREGRRWFSALLELVGSRDSESVCKSTLAVARHGAGTMAFALGEFADAQSELEQAVALYREAGTRKGEADALTFLGLAKEKGDHQAAREALTAARSIYEEIGDDGGLAHSLKCLASNAQYLGDVRQARDLIERGLALYRKREDQRGICMMLGELAGLNLAQGEYAQAEETLKEHLELSQELNDMSHTALALENLGKALRGRGDFYVARSYFEQCLAVYRELGNRWGILTAHHNLGIIAMEQGSFRQAQELFDESLRIGREIGEKRSIAAVLGDVGILKHRTGDFATARTNYEESLQAYRDLRDRLGESKALRDLGLLALDEGQLDEAEDLQNQSLAIAREIGNRHGVAMGLFNVGNIRRHKGDFASARALWEECRVIDRELGIKGGSVLGALGTLAERAGDFARARKLWTASLREHWGIGDRLGAAECLEALADIALGEGEPEKSARLHGAADRLRETIGAPLTASKREMDERRAERLRSSLGDQVAKSLISEGRDLPIDKAVVTALTPTASSATN